MIENILIVDDEPLIGRFLAEALRKKGYQTTSLESGKKALTYLKENNCDLLISDVKMADLSGIDLLKKVKEEFPEMAVIIMTAFGSVENAVHAMQLGAFNYILKPFTIDVIETLIEKAKEHLLLVKENSYLKKEISKSQTPLKIIAKSQPMKKIWADIQKIAKSNASVFIQGESGTGKEVIAGAIHSFSNRASTPYIKVNCAAIPDSLVESEFFGHEKGAFTGALLKRQGRFELADRGTLFLDEVTEIPLSLQPKLLRAIQEQEFERVGGTKSLKVDVRLIASSNRDLKTAIKEKIFREDLYYRLNVVPLTLPPLRERVEDIGPLSEYFLDQFSIENHKKKKKLSPDALKKLESYPWPGNIRELANLIERCVVLDFGDILEPDHLNLESSFSSR